MAVISNREAYLASEPEMDITQFHKTALDLKYADESENQILDIFYPEDGEGPYPLVIVFHGGAFCGGAQENTLYQINVSAYNTGIRSCNSRVQTLPRRKMAGTAYRWKSCNSLFTCKCKRVKSRS